MLGTTKAIFTIPRSLHGNPVGLLPPILLLFCLFSFQVHAAGDDFESAMRAARDHFAEGEYLLTGEDLQKARTQAATAEQQAEIDGLLGQTHFQMGHYEIAEGFLRKAIDAENRNSGERARWLNVMANIQIRAGNNDEARRFYQNALTAAGGDPELTVGIRIGLASLTPPEQRLAELYSITPSLDGIADPIHRARCQIQLGAQARQLGRAGMKLAFDSFSGARVILSERQPRLLTECLDGLAQLYEDQNRADEAMLLNTQAIQLAQGLDARDLLVNLDWRQGRLHLANRHLEEAGVYFQDAVNHIEAIRQDIPVEYRDGRSSFRVLLEPVYLGLADVLLRQAAERQGEDRTALLRRARGAVELIKQSELEDFLGGRCAVQNYKNVHLDNVETATAIVYPISLPDRLEVLISAGGDIRQFSQAIPRETVQKHALLLAHALRNGEAKANPLSKQLYDWLIAPAESWLGERQVKTLVMVPDGPLRMVPAAALYDGEKYLVERYAIATSPGLSIIGSKPASAGGGKALLVGMSEPGPVVEHLPPVFLEAIIDPDGRGVDISGKTASRALPVKLHPNDSKTRRLDLARLVKDAVFQRNLKDALSLPGVAEEINTLRGEIPNTVLMNQDFTVDRFDRQIVKEPYGIVHIASHGVFGGTADTTFLMAYDNIIDIDSLERLLLLDKFVKQPVELLTLSACQTAEGDDRAPLGISGMALKARVRSALGSLWSVSDEAASQLMVEFYKALAQPGVSKAQALRQAQMSLIKQKKTENPFFWSPFILVGNWL